MTSGGESKGEATEAFRDRKFREAMQLCGALVARIDAGEPEPRPMLAASVLQGLIRPLAFMEARSKILLHTHPFPEVKNIADRILPRYRAMILMALAAAAESEGMPDISAPITDRSVDVLHRHADGSWWGCVGLLNETLNSFFTRSDHKPSEETIEYWTEMVLHIARLREAVYRLRTLFAMRILWTLNPVSLDLVECIKKDIEDVPKLSYVPDDRKIVFRSDFERCVVLADPTWAVTYSKEFIRNAAQFSPAGSEVRVSLSVEGRTAAFFVDDDGVGFDMGESLALQPFMRSLTSLPGDGHNCRLGIGLTSVKLAAEKSGWRFEFAEGKNSRRPLLLMPLG